MTNQDYKEYFNYIYNEYIHRDGAAELLEYLESTDFFTAPASTKYHGNFSGGLCEHSMKVYDRLKAMQTDESNETIAICALLHDICKTNFYIVEYRNQKNERGQWDRVPYWKVNDTLGMGHGEASVFLVMRYMKLTEEEALAIRHHMGGFDEATKGGSYAMNTAWVKYPICVKLNCADTLASYLDEKTEK